MTVIDYTRLLELDCSPKSQDGFYDKASFCFVERIAPLQTDRHRFQSCLFFNAAF
jgi:hypothetical protein